MNRLTQQITLALGISIISLSCLPVVAEDTYSYTPSYTAPSDNTLLAQSLPPLQGYVATAPAGSMMSASFQQTVSSEYARVGDRFYATLANDLASGGNTILRAGTRIEGQVFSVKDAGRGGRNGELDIRFVSATLPDGRSVPISARIQTQDGSGIIDGGTLKGSLGRTAVRTGAGAAAGAVLGTALGPLSGGSVGRGAIYGTAVGAGGGALYALSKKGKEAVLPAGQPITVVLDQPLTLSPAQNAQPSYGQPNYNQPYGQPNYSQPSTYGSTPYNDPYGQQQQQQQPYQQQPYQQPYSY